MISDSNIRLATLFQQKTRVNQIDFVQQKIKSLIDLSKIVLPIFVSDRLAEDKSEKDDDHQFLPGLKCWIPNKEFVEDVTRMVNNGLNAILLFGCMPTDAVKDNLGLLALEEKGPVIQAIRILKKANLNLVIIADVCLCAYTPHGHCGILVERGKINPYFFCENNDNNNNNNNTLLLSGTYYIQSEISGNAFNRVALAYAEAGVDAVALSSMQDGHVAAVRKGLDKQNFKYIQILSYSAKFCSSSYAPFRTTSNCALQKGETRATYQLPYDLNCGTKLSAQVIKRDISQGACAIIVKPAGNYLDIVYNASKKEITGVEYPIAVYHVSGEYKKMREDFMENNNNNNNPLLKEAILEFLENCFQAGASIVITYFARDLFDILLLYKTNQ